MTARSIHLPPPPHRLNRLPYKLEWYNGFSPEERFATNPIQREAMRSGKLMQPIACSICGFSNPEDLRGSGYIFLHLEDYRQPLAIHPACKKCHAALHARFRDPQRWLGIAEAAFRTGAWFTLLTMDPASQRRSFDITYPNGLPPAQVTRGKAITRTLFYKELE